MVGAVIDARNGCFRLLINVWVAGKTVWFLVTTCRTWVP